MSESICPHGDESCPCPDGDACHYRAYPAADGWPATEAMRCMSSACTVPAADHDLPPGWAPNAGDAPTVGGTVGASPAFGGHGVHAAL